VTSVEKNLSSVWIVDDNPRSAVLVMPQGELTADQVRFTTKVDTLHVLIMGWSEKLYGRDDRRRSHLRPVRAIVPFSIPMR
jgi:hypothetical protein